MKKVLHFETTLTEINCPGLSGMNEDEIKECAIEFVKIEKESEILKSPGKWLANILGRSGDGIIIDVSFHFDEIVN